MSQVLFICSGNYYRSRFAEILFNDMARKERLEWTAASRGFRLSPNNVGPLSPHTIRACEGSGLLYEPDRWPTVLTEPDLQAATRIIALKETEHRPMMRAAYPAWSDMIEYWEIHDIDVADPAVALVELRTAVTDLIAELKLVHSITTERD